MEIAKKVLGLGTVAAVAFACWLPAQSSAASSAAMQANAHSAHGVKCYGINKCKGKSACACPKSKCKGMHNKCKGMHNKCKGMNACKGKGFVMKKSAKSCMKKGGSLTPMAPAAR